MATTNPTQLFSVEGMVIVVTGGATGIGLMMTKAFATAGAHKVYIVGRRKEKLDDAAKISPENIIPVVGDVTSKESLQNVASQIKQEVGYVNLVVCNSGVHPPAIPIKPVNASSLSEYAAAALNQNTDDWNNTFATNSTSIAFTTFAFLELLDAGNKQSSNPGGHRSQVLATTSIAGVLRAPGSNMAYCASKAAATHLIKHLAGTLAPFGIRVNGLAPGLFPSELAEGVIQGVNPNGGDPTVEGAIDKKIIPAERVGREEDMAGTVIYLASAAGAYLNGNITVLDGGRVSQLPGTY